MFKHVFCLLALVAAGSTVHAGVIDDFSSNAGASQIDTDGVPNSSGDVAFTGSTLFETRDLFARRIGASGLTIININTANEFISLLGEEGASSDWRITYDAAADVDMTEGGTHGSIFIDFIGSNGGTIEIVPVDADGNNIDVLVIVPSGNNEQTIPFSSFPGVDFTRIDSLTFFFTGGFEVDFTIEDFLTLPVEGRAVPLPGAFSMGLVGLAGIALMRRRRSA